jgi:hypothetical protein
MLNRSACCLSHAVFFDPEDEGDVFPLVEFRRTTWCYISQDKILLVTEQQLNKMVFVSKQNGVPHAIYHEGLKNRDTEYLFFAYLNLAVDLGG